MAINPIRSKAGIFVSALVTAITLASLACGGDSNSQNKTPTPNQTAAPTVTYTRHPFQNKTPTLTYTQPQKPSPTTITSPTSSNSSPVFTSVTDNVPVRDLLPDDTSKLEVNILSYFAGIKTTIEEGGEAYMRLISSDQMGCYKAEVYAIDSDGNLIPDLTKQFLFQDDFQLEKASLKFTSLHQGPVYPLQDVYPHNSLNRSVTSCLTGGQSFHNDPFEGPIHIEGDRSPHQSMIIGPPSIENALNDPSAIARIWENLEPTTHDLTLPESIRIFVLMEYNPDNLN